MPAFMKLLEEWQNPSETETDLIRSLWLLIAAPSSASLEEILAFCGSSGQPAAQLSLQGCDSESPILSISSRQKSFSLLSEE